MFRRISITTFEDLSNELIYEIFDYMDYMDYIEIYLSFSQLNKRYLALVKHYPTPTINFNKNMKDDVFKSLYHSLIVAHQHRIRSMQFPSWRNVDLFISTYCVDGSFPCLQSLTLLEIEPNNILTVLTRLQTLPSLSRLSLKIDLVAKSPPDMTIVYQMLLDFKSLKSLMVSTMCSFHYDYLDLFTPSILNQQPSNLEYLVIDHLISISILISIVTYTPKLRYLCLAELDTQHDLVDIISRTILVPKLSQLIKLKIGHSILTAEDLELLLNAFDCRLKTLKIATYSYYSFCIDEQWENLMDARLSDLHIFEIDFSRLKFSNFYSYYDNEEATEAVKKRRFQSLLDFVCNPFWHKRRWMAEIIASSDSVTSSFSNSK